MVEITKEKLNALVRDQVEEILAGELGKSGGIPFTREYRDIIENLNAQVGQYLGSATTVNSGPQWISGTSVVNGTITADKLIVTELEAVTASTGDLNVTGSITAAASFPAVAARIVINSTGLAGYNSTPTQTFGLNVDGSGFIGVGATAMSWTTGGVLTVPVASIGSLTIASVGGGVLGGTYQTATSGAHINISTTGIVVYNATSEIAANETFRLNAATGAVTATGSFTIQSATSGARVVISNAGGIEGYKNTSTRTFLFNAATGAGFIGTDPGTIAWDSSGNVTVDGSVLVNGTVTATKLSVTTLSAISANAGTITAGTITAATITTGTMNADRISGGSVGGSFNFGTSDITINSTGKLFFGSGADDYLANDILHFEVTSGESAKIEFADSGVATYKATLSGSAATGLSLVGMNAIGASSRQGIVSASGASSDALTGIALYGIKSGGGAGASYTMYADGAHTWLVDATTTGMALARTNRALSLYGRLYPGTGSATQTNNYVFMSDANTMQVKLGDTAGTNAFQIVDSAGQVQWGVSSNGVLAYPDADTTAAGAYKGRISLFVNGVQQYLHYFDA